MQTCSCLRAGREKQDLSGEASEPAEHEPRDCTKRRGKVAVIGDSSCAGYSHHLPTWLGTAGVSFLARWSDSGCCGETAKARLALGPLPFAARPGISGTAKVTLHTSRMTPELWWQGRKGWCSLLAPSGEGKRLRYGRLVNSWCHSKALCSVILETFEGEGLTA